MKSPKAIARVRTSHNRINALIRKGKGRQAWQELQSQPAAYRAVFALCVYIGTCRRAILSKQLVAPMMEQDA